MPDPLAERRYRRPMPLHQRQPVVIEMPQKKRRSPSEKKRLARARDHRPAYGENQKAARKAIPKRKAMANRIVRRRDKAALAVDPERADALLVQTQRARWQKAPDLPLGRWIEAQRRRRTASVGAKAHRRDAQRRLLERLGVPDA
ncbi:MAG: hypothetical protein AAGC57_13570 [Pseudomonadota bacterium]